MALDLGLRDHQRSVLPSKSLIGCTNGPVYLAEGVRRQGILVKKKGVAIGAINNNYSGGIRMAIPIVIISITIKAMEAIFLE